MPRDDSPEAVARRFCGLTAYQLSIEHPDVEPWAEREVRGIKYTDVLKLVKRERRRAKVAYNAIAEAKSMLQRELLGRTPTRRRRRG